ncbi:MAG: sugar phosphate isomerase/epimerase family protein [Agathobacter sp.]
MDFGMPTLVENKTLDDNVSLCRKLGLQFIELNMNFPQYQIECLEQVEIYREIMKREGIYFTIHLDENLNVADFNHAVAEAYVETTKRAIEVAHKIHVPILNMHMNHGIYLTLPDRKVQMFEEYFDTYMEAMERFIQMCDSQIGEDDIHISIENTDGFYNYEKRAIERMLQSNCFSLTWDIGHSHAVEDVDEPFFMEHEDRLLHFHIHDAWKKKNHQTLGTGEIDLSQRLSLAKKHHCRCVVETKTIAALQESVEWIHKTI